MKVYLVIPTHDGGMVEASIVQWIMSLPKIDGVEYECDMVRDKPVVSTRNKTVRRFLASDCDVYFTVDDDMVPTTPDDPFHGGLKLLLEDIAKPEVDVVSGFALKSTPTGPVPVLMKITNPYQATLYTDIIGKPPGLHRLEEGATGAACLLAKRHVLEKFKEDGTVWFLDEFETNPEAEEFGGRIMGQDCWFWQNAERLGFGCFIDTRVHWGHVKMCDLRAEFNREQSNLAAEQRMSRLPLCFAESARRLWGNTDYSASSEYMVEALMYAADVPQDQMIVECGSGVSTLALSMILTPDRYHVYEQDKEWRDYALDKIDYLGEVIVRCPLHDCGEYDWYKRKVDPHLPVGLLLVDGPSGDTRGGRMGALPEMYPFLAGKFRVILDDVQREAEKAVMDQWVKQYNLTPITRPTGDGRQFAIMEGAK